jgi:uncharacterized protein (DUF2062 family)
MPESERTTTLGSGSSIARGFSRVRWGSGDGMSGSLLRRKLVRPIIDLLKQGVTPEKMALSLALGATLGIFPVLGSTTALCAIAALAFGLNLPAIQIVNYFVYPAQIALLIPFFRLGERLFRAPHLAISVPQIYAMLHENVWSVVRLLWTTTWHAIVVWCLAAPLIVPVMYVALAPLLRRVLRRQMTSAVGQA